MNNENETAAALERARCEVRFFREVLAKIATPGPRVRRLKLAQAALGFWASLCDRGAGDFVEMDQARPISKAARPKKRRPR